MNELVIANKSDIVAIADAVRNKKGNTEQMSLAEIALGLDNIANRTSSDVIVDGATVTVPVGNYKEQAIKTVATAPQATPTITVDSTGLITATATQTAGYVAAGTKTMTQQLAFQAATTITPTTVAQTAVEAGKYTTGAITVAGDANLVAGNIAKDVTIFGVKGTLAGGGGTEMEDSLVMGALTNYTNDRVTIVSNAFRQLTTADFPACTRIDTYAFYSCTSLTSINFPACTTIGESAFYNCSKLTSVNFPVCTSVGSNAFYGCTSLTSVVLNACTSIYSSAFYSCTNLTTLILCASSVCKLGASNVFTSTPIKSGTGYIYVPASLVTTYQAATNWTYFANQFRAIEDYPDITGWIDDSGNTDDPEGTEG